MGKAAINCEVIRPEFEWSRQVIEEHRDRQDTVTMLLDRVEALLLGLANELDGVVAEVIRLQATAPEDAVPRVLDLVNGLREQAAQIKVFEREVIQV